MPDISSRKKGFERPRSTTVAKYRLKENGLCMSSSSYTLYKYCVTEGDILYLKLLEIVISNVSYAVYQWQSAETVPTSGTNSALVGTQVTGAVDTFVEVPEGATWLIVCQLTATTTFEVRSTNLDENSISDIILPDESQYNLKDKIARASIPFSTTDFSSTSTVFKATVEGITELKSGVACYIMNTKVTSASDCTININGLGAKPLYLPTAAASRVTTQFTLNYTWLLVYNEHRVSGGCWDMCHMFNSDNNTVGYNLRVYTGSIKMKSALYRYAIVLTIDETTGVPVNSVSNNTGTSKTLTTESFDPFGPIYYYSTTTTVAAGALLGAGSRWTQYYFDLRYSFNTGSTLTSHKVIYIVATPQSDGKAKLATNPISQDLPTTEDGLIYIRLGVAYSEYQIQMENNHPIYYYKNGQIRLWTNAGNVQITDNLVTSISSLSTDTEYPSAKCMYDIIGDVETLLAAI